MSFIETPRFPVDVNYGTMGGPVYSTDIVTFGNGGEYRNANWSIPKYEYDVKYAVKSRTDLLNVYEFFNAQQGQAFGFRIKDLWDFTTNTNAKGAHAQDDVTLGVGDGTESTFQLIKPYTKGSSTINRIITKPVVGTLLLELNGVLQTITTQYTIDTTTGIVTFVTPPPNAEVIKAGFEFDVPVRFKTDDMSTVRQQLYTSNGVDIATIDTIPLIEIR